ncbi:MAG TPA: hypothetical protein VMF08_13575 [Candidatus Sulfotelmatobacter sp.]|nr:hypothetical protein [Candidatus Sulfotelmatobacter sp.]
MNIRSAELLQNGLQNAAENALRNREIQQAGQLEAQRIAVDNAFRQAQMAHYNQMENRQQDFFNRQQQSAEDRATLEAGNQQRQLQQQGIAQKQGVLKVIMQLNATGQLSPDGLKRVNQWLSTDPQMSPLGMQLQAPANPSKNPQHAQVALLQAMDQLQQFRQLEAGATDPNQKAQWKQYGDDLEQAITHNKQGEVDTTTDANGKVLRTTTRTSLPVQGGPTGIGTKPANDEAGDDAPGTSTNTPALPASVPNAGAAGTSSSSSSSSILNPPLSVLAPMTAPSLGVSQNNVTGIPMPNSAQTNAPAFGSPVDVRTAYQAGKIDKPTATQILQTHFGYQ